MIQSLKKISMQQHSSILEIAGFENLDDVLGLTEEDLNENFEEKERTIVSQIIKLWKEKNEKPSFEEGSIGKWLFDLQLKTDKLVAAGWNLSSPKSSITVDQLLKLKSVSLEPADHIKILEDFFGSEIVSRFRNWLQSIGLGYVYETLLFQCIHSRESLSSANDEVFNKIEKLGSKMKLKRRSQGAKDVGGTQARTFLTDHFDSSVVSAVVELYGFEDLEDLAELVARSEKLSELKEVKIGFRTRLARLIKENAPKTTTPTVTSEQATPNNSTPVGSSSGPANVVAPTLNVSTPTPTPEQSNPATPATTTSEQSKPSPPTAIPTPIQVVTPTQTPAAAPIPVVIPPVQGMFVQKFFFHLF